MEIQPDATEWRLIRRISQNSATEMVLSDFEYKYRRDA